MQSVAFAPDGRTFAMSRYAKPFVRICDAETGRERRRSRSKNNRTMEASLRFPATESELPWVVRRE